MNAIERVPNQQQIRIQQLIVGGGILLMVLRLQASAVTVTPAEMGEARAWAAAHFEVAEGKRAPFPFSFIYGGHPSAELLKDWKFERGSKKLDEQRTSRTLTWTDPGTGLSVQCLGIEYHDFPTVEWTLYFTNAGSADTPILENIQALAMRQERGEKGEFILHHNVGSPAAPNDYQPLLTPAMGWSVKGNRVVNLFFSFFRFLLSDSARWGVF